MTIYLDFLAVAGVILGLVAAALNVLAARRFIGARRILRVCTVITSTYLAVFYFLDLIGITAAGVQGALLTRPAIVSCLAIFVAYTIADHT